jgi:hypothetical protein
VATESPTFELFGTLSDEAIEAIAALLLSIHEDETKQESSVVSQEEAS